MKVRLVMQFRGREMAHMDYGRRRMDQAKIDLADSGELEMDSRVEGNTMASIYAPKRGLPVAKSATEPMAAGEA